jgi:hypothetical protein
MIVEVFKTNVSGNHEANEVVALLLEHFPGSRINFDLDDCDRILRIEGAGFTTEEVMLLVKRKGVACTLLN